MTSTILAAAPQIVELEPRHAAVVRVVGATAELPSMLRDAFGATARQIGVSGAQTAGPPFARYLAFGATVEAEVGFPYTGSLVRRSAFTTRRCPAAAPS